MAAGDPSLLCHPTSPAGPGVPREADQRSLSHEAVTPTGTAGIIGCRHVSTGHSLCVLATPKKRQWGAVCATADDFNNADAANVAATYRFDFGRISRDRQFSGAADSGAKHRYEAARQCLSHCPSERFGFQLFPNFVTPAEALEVLSFCESVSQWERRGENTSNPMPDTARLNLGVTLDRSYRPRALTDLPPVLRLLGDRALEFCKARAWPFACTAIASQRPFDQAYIQRYRAGQSTDACGQTLGFHFDARSDFAELIVGLSICGRGKLLLSMTQGAQECTPQQATRHNVKGVPLPALSMYCLSGMSRYDLRHAVLQEGKHERISITFRSLARSPQPKP